MPIKIKLGEIVMIFGIIGLFLGLISKVSSFIKALMLIFFIALILFGIFVETPLLGHYNVPPEDQQSFE